MIRLHNVSLSLPQGKSILENISWEIGRKENWILFGRNGSGKTRLLEIISGYRFPSQGSIERFEGEADTRDIRELRKRIGYVSTILREKFNPKEPVIDVVLSGLYASVGIYQNVNKRDHDLAMELLEMSGLAEKKNLMLGVLSDGERQKILALRGFINEPDLLILDESTKGLDLAAREDFLSLISNISKDRNLSIIYVTHHVEEIIPIFSKILILHEGREFFKGTVKEGINDLRLTELFQQPVQVKNIKGRYYTFL